MDIQAGSTRSEFAPVQSSIRQPIRVHPNYPLLSSVAPSGSLDRSPPLDDTKGNGVARTASRRRRVSGAGSAGKAQLESFPRPPAPDVPRAPPVSYRNPYANGDPSTIRNTNSTSFAARASAIPGGSDLISSDPSASGSEQVGQASRHNRRGSLNRSSAVPYPEDQYAFVSPTVDPISTQPSSKASTSGQQQPTGQPLPRRPVNSTTSRPYSEVNLPSPSTNRRQSSTGVADSRSGWAPDRSPLQTLEVKLNDISKEEKRARVEQAEQRLRNSKASNGRSRTDNKADPSVNRIPARRVSADTGSRSKEGSPKQARQVREGYPQGIDHSPRDAPADSEAIDDTHARPDRYQELRSERAPAGADQYSSQGRTRQTARRSSELTKPEQQPGRAVRFEGNGQLEDLGSSPENYHGPGLEYSNGLDRQSVAYQQEAAPDLGKATSLQYKRSSQGQTKMGSRYSKQVPSQQQNLYSSRAQSSAPNETAATYGGLPDPVPGNAVLGQSQHHTYEIPPQTASGINAKQTVGFSSPQAAVGNASDGRSHRLSGILHHGHKDQNRQPKVLDTTPRRLDEWKHGGTARLTAADHRAEAEPVTKSNTWWEGGGSGSKRTSRKTDFDTSSNDQTTIGDDQDAESTYNPAPFLRLYPEPMELLPPPPQQVNDESGQSLPAEYIDPVAGLPKLSRIGTTLYVKPVEDLEQGADLSRVEDDTGLYEETRTAAVPTSYGTPNFHPSSGKGNDRHGTPKRPKKGQEVRGVRLHAERGVTFWRFNLEVELTGHEARIAYRINHSAPVGFWVPAKGQTMNVMFHSCNGFSMSVNPAQFSGPDPLWRDVLNAHQTRPFHAMIGGGDQIYNDAVMTQTKLFQRWLGIKNPHHKNEAEFTSEMREEMETFYLERYAMWFSQGLFGMANSQIPMINLWDDHDIIDGFGSYPHHFMSTPVFCGLGAVAFKYYMLFQHQSVSDEGQADEPSWLMGASPGPYINELSRSIFVFLGKHVALLGLDTRTERMRSEVLSEESYKLVFDRCRREIIEGETKHLIVLLGVPIAYPRLVWLETLLTSRVMDPVKALARAGMLGGFLNKFDGGVEILDDLDDHWTAKNHKQERNWFIQELQELAAEKSVRVTILGGDVHLAAIGQFYSKRKLAIPKDKDHRYMANIISSAIVNTPPPAVMGDILNKRNKIHHLDNDTEENMIPIFTHDVDGKPRSNKRLLPRRNWCSIREYHPGSTPPATPTASEPQTPSDESPRPTNRLQRTLSLTRGDVTPGGLIRRLSGRGPPPTDYPPSNEYRPSTATAAPPTADGYFTPQHNQQPLTSNPHDNTNNSAPLPRPGNFHRRPTNQAEKAATKGDTDQTEGHINLERGLDIVINCEVNQLDPAGITTPYRLLIPALFYQGSGDLNTIDYKKKSFPKRLLTFRSGNKKQSDQLASGQGQGNWGGGSESEIDSQDEVGHNGDLKQRVPGGSQERDYWNSQGRHDNEKVRGNGYNSGGQRNNRQPQQPQQQQKFGVQALQAQDYGYETPSPSPQQQQQQKRQGLQDSSYPPTRRLSKVDRMLGVSGDNARGGGTNIPAARSEGFLDTHDGSGQGGAGGPAGRGYDGIEAYQGKKGWRRFF